MEPSWVSSWWFQQQENGTWLLWDSAPWRRIGAGGAVRRRQVAVGCNGVEAIVVDGTGNWGGASGVHGVRGGGQIRSRRS